MEHTELNLNFIFLSFFIHVPIEETIWVIFLQRIVMFYYFRIHICKQFVMDNIESNNFVNLS
jgi:hypothetical protein